MADLNGDGFLDVALSNTGFQYDGVEIYWGAPNGTFAGPLSRELVWSVSYVLGAQADGDPESELLV